MSDRTSRMLFAFLLFISCFVGRIVLQLVGGPNAGDLSWITTFGIIGATWLGLDAKLSTVERNTNGTLSKLTDEHASQVAQEAVRRVIESQNSHDPDELSLRPEPSEESSEEGSSGANRA